MGLMFQPLWKYATFYGRARRMEYWLFVLLYVLVSIVTVLVDITFGLWLVDGEVVIGIVSTIYGLVLLLPSWAVLVRRLHDTGRSGWWVLLFFVPVVGVIVLMVFCCLRGDAGTNRFGPDPLLSRA